MQIKHWVIPRYEIVQEQPHGLLDWGLAKEAKRLT